MKKNSSTRKPNNRRKPLKGSAAANNTARAETSRRNNHDRLAASHDAVVGLHEVAVGQLTQLSGLVEIVKDPTVIEKLSPEAEKALGEQVKIVTDSARENHRELTELTKELNRLAPDPKVRLNKDETVDQNAEILSVAGRYGGLMEKYDVVTMPAVNACLDIVNSTLPDDKKLNLADYQTAVHEEQVTLVQSVETIMAKGE